MKSPVWQRVHPLIQWWARVLLCIVLFFVAAPVSAETITLDRSDSVEMNVVDPPAETSLVIDLTMWGQPEQHYSHSPADGNFQIQRNRNGVTIQFTSYDRSKKDWYLRFAAPYEGPLGVGRYNAVDFSVLERGRAKMAIGNLYKGESGSFEIKKIIYAANGSITAFWASFVEAPWLTGEIKFNAGSTAPSTNQAPVAFANKTKTFWGYEPTRVLINKPVNWFGDAVDDGQPSPEALTRTWSTVRGPASAIFSDPTAEITTITFPKPGSYILRFTASDGEFSASDETEFEVIDPQANTLVKFRDDDGRHSFNQNNAAIYVDRYSGNEIEVYVSSLTNENDTWSFTFHLPQGVEPAPGFYAHAGPDHSDSQPDFAHSNHFFSYGYGTTCAFLIKQIEYGIDGSVAAFWATFRLGSTRDPWLTGEIRFNAAKNASLENFAPYVDAGEDQVVRNESVVFLEGFAADDGVLAGRRLATRWSMVSGPGKVHFKNAAAPQTTATFSAPGTYVLRLTATNGSRNAFDELTVTQTAESTSLRILSSRGDEVGQGAAHFFTPRNGTFSANGWNNLVQIEFATYREWDPDDPLSHKWRLEFAPPTGETLKPGLYSPSGAWSEAGRSKLIVSGSSYPINPIGSFQIHQLEYEPGGKLISFWATFTQLDSASSGELTGEIRYNASGIRPEITGPNQPPIVKATATAPYISKSDLRGSVIDDGLPYGARVSTRWNVISGPGVVTFVDATSLITEATFSAPGSYVLRLTGSDGVLSSSSDVSLEVSEESPSIGVPTGAFSGLAVADGSGTLHGTVRLTLNKRLLAEMSG